jgi:hypothetical protein
MAAVEQRLANGSVLAAVRGDGADAPTDAKDFEVMGKAAIIAAAMVIIAVAVFLLIGWMRRQDTKDKAREKGWALKGDLSRSQEKAILLLLHDAAQILHDIRNPAAESLDYVSYLSPDDRSKVEHWLQSYEKGKLTIS